MDKKNHLKHKLKPNFTAADVLSLLHLRPWHIFAVAAIVVLMIITADLRANYGQIARDNITEEELDMDYIYFNVFASDIQLGGLTKEQAAKKLEKELNFDRIDGKVIYLSTNNGLYENQITYDDMGVRYNIDEIIGEAYNHARTGSKEDRLAEIRRLYDVGYFIDPHMEYDEQKITEFLSSIESDVNSVLDSGEKLDIERAAEMIKQQLDIKEYDSTIYLPIK